MTAGCFHSLVIQKPIHKDLTGIFFFIERFFSGEEHLGFNINEECSDEQKFSFPVEVYPVLLVKIVQVFSGDRRHGDIVNVDFFLLD